MEGLELILLISFFLCFGSLFQRNLRYAIAGIGAFIVVAQGVVILMDSSLTDDRFWFHLNFRDIWIGSTFFGWRRWLILPLLVIMALVLYKGSRWLAFAKQLSNTKRILLTILCLLIYMFIGWNDTKSNLSMPYSGTQESIQTHLEAVGFPRDQYVFPDEVVAQAGKNVVVIYLESLENGYFNKELVHLVPNLAGLRKSWTYRPMAQGVGSEWSAASFYTGIYGLPAFFSLGAGGNAIFQNTRQVNLTGIGHVYEAADYERVFLLGNKSFAGLNDMLSASRFIVKSEVDFTTEYVQVPWGLNDIDLFAEAKKELQRLDRTGKPFVLHLATIGSHGPNGFYDPRVESLIQSNTRNTLHKMVRATDALVGEFLSYMNNNDFLRNTVVFIMPDHLLMSQTPTVEKLGEHRSLFLLSNAALELADTIHQIELPAVMLRGANIVHNADFLSNHIEENGVERLLRDRKQHIQSLNEAAVTGQNLSAGFELVKRGKDVVITAPFLNQTHQLPEGEMVLCLNLDHKFRIRKSNYLTLYNAFHEADRTSVPNLIIDQKKNKLYAAIHYGNSRIVSKSDIKKIVFTQEDIQQLREWPYSPAFYQLPSAPTYHASENQVLVTSTSTGDAQILTPSQIVLYDRDIKLQRHGLYLIKKDGSIHYFNPRARRDIQQLATMVSAPEKLGGIMVHGNGHGPFNDILSAHGLIKLSNLGEDMAYVAYPYHGFLSEHTSANTLSFALNLDPNSTPDERIKSWSKDRTRFIAHAGGTIDGIRYTNSLEALDRAYENGFRFFELDIIQTSDDHFVAAHDWKKWHEMTYSEGREPVSLDLFLKKPLLGKYTALDMDRINLWFEQHPDAILVTDKINHPIPFSKAFHYPERLIMELFSLDAIKDAQTVPSIEVMVNEQVLQSLGPNSLAFLQQHEIHKAAVSRNFLHNASDRCAELRDNGIQIFAYHLNMDDQKNEVYVLHHDLPLAYGMYADDWKF